MAGLVNFNPITAGSNRLYVRFDGQKVAFQGIWILIITDWHVEQTRLQVPRDLPGA